MMIITAAAVEVEDMEEEVLEVDTAAEEVLTEVMAEVTEVAMDIIKPIYHKNFYVSNSFFRSSLILDLNRITSSLSIPEITTIITKIVFI